MNLYPLKLKPVLKDIIWGGTRLSNEYGKGAPNQKIAESWELCVHKNGVNIIENGLYEGKTLEWLFDSDKNIISKNYISEKFPVLIKFIDAKHDLSVQVHPNDAYAALRSTESGKTEMWYILDCAPGARLVYGLNADYTREELEHSINSGEFENCLNYITVKPKDVFFIPAGLIHAIGAGILLAEIQQNSDTTYRMYDYNRTDDEGKTRELHIKEALDVCIKTKSEYTSPQKGDLLTECEYFSVSRNIPSAPAGFVSVICHGGEGKIISGGKEYRIKKGESYFIPAGCGAEITGNPDLIFTYC